MKARSSSLECAITAPDSLDIGQPMKILATLRNTGPMAVSVLAKSTFLSPQPHHFLVLKHCGEVLLDRNVATPEESILEPEYICIPAGASVAKELDINDHYSIDEAGDYELSIHMPVIAILDRDVVTAPVLDGDCRPVMVESPSVTVAIRSDQSRPPLSRAADMSSGPSRSGAATAEREFPDEPAEPVITGLSKDQAERYYDAHRWAHRSILAALSVMNGTPNQLVMDYVDAGAGEGGSEFEGRRRVVINNLEAMARQMTKGLTYSRANGAASCPAGRIAFCNLGTSSIGLCSPAFDDHYLTLSYGNDPAWVRALVVVHELSHGACHTVDQNSGYTEGDCKQLARANPNQAIHNAQNYALLAMRANPEPPESTRPSTGIWGVRNLPSSSETSHNPAVAAFPEAGVVMMAYRDDIESKKGKLWFRALLGGPHGDRDDWQQDEPLKNAHGDLCSSLREPALVAFAQMTQQDGLCCIYVETASRHLALLEARNGRDGTLAQTMKARKWSEIVWQPYLLEQFPKSSDRYGPCLAYFESQVFCMYVDESGMLRCLSNTDTKTFGGVWNEVEISQRADYKSSSQPSMVVFDGRLRATVKVGTTLQMLEYSNSRWNYFASFEASGNDTLALAQWDTARGPRLVGMGKIMNGNNLRYIVSRGDGSTQSGQDFWAPAHTLTLISSSTGAALVSCGGTLHAFYRDESNKIRWMVAHPA